MIHGSLTGVARALGGTLLGPDPGFAGVSTDTRTLARGELFVALRGPNHDGHEFVVQAAEAGAAGAVVDHPVAVNLPQLLVGETLAALGG
ncbi:MAG: Mur ligase domain-containing protein, partial [Gammaproteobacteria bacterium]